MTFLWIFPLLLLPLTSLCDSFTLSSAHIRATQPLGIETSSPILGKRSTFKVKYAGVNIAGFEFGCTHDGYCPLNAVLPPGLAGLGQLVHFISTDNLTAARIPASWQGLVDDQLGGPLQGSYFDSYHALVQACVKQGGQFCIVDVHNYARWNGQIIGQSAALPNAPFVDLWTRIAELFKDTPEVAFGLMNEPHDLDFPTWTGTLQAVVTAIRKAGAQNNILLPGSQFSAAGALLGGEADALAAITNPDGSTAGLIIDVHVYLDYDHTGTHAICVSNSIEEAVGPLATWLRTNKRLAFISETGGSNDRSCLNYFCQLVDFLSQSSDVYLGFTSWGAGSFSPDYVLSNTPRQRGERGGFVDQPLVSQCIVGSS